MPVTGIIYYISIIWQLTKWLVLCHSSRSYNEGPESIFFKRIDSRLRGNDIK